MIFLFGFSSLVSDVVENNLDFVITTSICCLNGQSFTRSFSFKRLCYINTIFVGSSSSSAIVCRERQRQLKHDQRPAKQKTLNSSRRCKIPLNCEKYVCKYIYNFQVVWIICCTIFPITNLMMFVDQGEPFDFLWSQSQMIFKLAEVTRIYWLSQGTF